jgi:hypothetical protein
VLDILCQWWIKTLQNCSCEGIYFGTLCAARATQWPEIKLIFNALAPLWRRKRFNLIPTCSALQIVLFNIAELWLLLLYVYVVYLIVILAMWLLAGLSAAAGITI